MNMLVLLLLIKLFRVEGGGGRGLPADDFKLPQDVIVNLERSPQLFLPLDLLWSLGWQGGTHS
jgi:hypothetical protein